MTIATYYCNYKIIKYRELCNIDVTINVAFLLQKLGEKMKEIISVTFEERALFFNEVGLNDLCSKAYKSLFFLLKNTKKQIDQKDISIDKEEMMAFSKMLENTNYK